jgi:hypothetical protein
VTGDNAHFVNAKQGVPLLPEVGSVLNNTRTLPTRMYANVHSSLRGSTTVVARTE